jgi:hypothetical protein
MIVQEQFVSIRTTPAAVERYLTDPALLKQWRSPLVELDPIDGTLMAPGSKHKLRLKTLALNGADYTVTARDSGRIEMSIDGLWRGNELWRWFSDGDRVVVQNRVEYEVPDPSLRVFALGLGQFVATFDMRIQLDRLRVLLEQGR